MPEYTDNLKLFKYNTETDGKQVFSINDCMNHNWDILDKQPGTLKTNQITNCLTEVPQRVKVRLDGTSLVLEAGFVVIVPYGTSEPTMEIGDTLNGGEIVDISWDGSKLFYFVKYQGFTITQTGSGYQALLNISPSGTYSSCGVIHAYSGTTAPSGNTNMSWYDTGSNIVKRTSDSGTTWKNYYSLPFIVVTYGDGVVASIDNVFNGFGFIGSTIWCDKGVKGLTANGRNADGTFNNIEFETEHVTINSRNWTVGAGQIQYSTIAEGVGINAFISTYYFEQDEAPSLQGHILWLNTAENVMYWQNNDNVWTKVNVTKVFDIVNTQTYTDGKIDYIGNVKQVFRAVDYADTEFIAHQAMPSNKYNELSISTTGATYTAPADGYFVHGRVANSGGYIQIYNKTTGLGTYTTSVGSNGYIRCFLPVSKGDTVQIDFITSGSSFVSRFIYAQGASND